MCVWLPLWVELFRRRRRSLKEKAAAAPKSERKERKDGGADAGRGNGAASKERPPSPRDRARTHTASVLSTLLHPRPLQPQPHKTRTRTATRTRDKQNRGGETQINSRQAPEKPKPSAAQLVASSCGHHDARLWHGACLVGASRASARGLLLSRAARGGPSREKNRRGEKRGRRARVSSSCAVSLRALSLQARARCAARP